MGELCDLNGLRFIYTVCIYHIYIYVYICIVFNMH